MFGIANNTEFLTAIGINDAPEDIKIRLIAGIEDLARKKLVIRVSEVITSEQAEQFNNIKDDAESYNWVMANIPNFQKIVQEVLSEVKDDILRHKESVTE